MSHGGFYKRYRSMLDHVEAGTIGLLELAVHDFISLKANWSVGANGLLPPGIWMGSAKAIHALGGRGCSERTVRRSLDRLEKLGLIRRWGTPGKRGNYPILVDGFCVRDLSGNEYVINAGETIDWREPKLEPVREVSNSCPKAGLELSAMKEERKKNSSEPAPRHSVDSRYQPVVTAYFDGSRKLRIDPVFDESDGKALKKLLGQHPDTAVEEILTWLKHALTSTRGPLETGFRFRQFGQYHTLYQLGPLLVAEPKTRARSNGAPTQAELYKAAEEKAREQVRVAS